MWLDLLALAILAVFAIIGAARGSLRAGMGLLALVVGYTAAILLAPALGPGVSGWLGVSEWLALPLGGTLGFAAGYGAVAVLGALLRRFAARHRDERTPRDIFLGALFGAVRGSLVVLLVSWLVLWIDALRATGADVPIPEISGSAVAALTGEVVEAGIGAALGDEPAGRVAARIASRPGAAMADLVEVLDNPNLEGLKGDTLFWTYVEHGNVDAALNRMSFRRIAQDPALRGQLAGLALVGPEAADDPRAFRDDVAAVLEEVGPRIRGLSSDPELQALMDDPQVVAMVQSGDTMGLLRHPGFRSLVDRVTSQQGEGASRVP